MSPTCHTYFITFPSLISLLSPFSSPFLLPRSSAHSARSFFFSFSCAVSVSASANAKVVCVFVCVRALFFRVMYVLTLLLWGVMIKNHMILSDMSAAPSLYHNASTSFKYSHTHSLSFCVCMCAFVSLPPSLLYFGTYEIFSHFGVGTQKGGRVVYRVAVNLKENMIKTNVNQRKQDTSLEHDPQESDSGGASSSSSLSALLYIHPTSFLVNNPPDVLTFTEIVQTSHHFLKVDPHPSLPLSPTLTHSLSPCAVVSHLFTHSLTHSPTLSLRYMPHLHSAK